MNLIHILSFLTASVYAYASKDWGSCGKFSDQDCFSDGFVCCNVLSDQTSGRGLQTKVAEPDRVCVDSKPFTNMITDNSFKIGETYATFSNYIPSTIRSLP